MSQEQAHNGSLCSRFGTIAVEMKFISIEQLKWALDEQLEDDLAKRPHRVLGAICFAHGWMTHEQINSVLNRMFKVRVRKSRETTSSSLQAV